MELRHLEQIAAICRTGSFSAAAKALGISQPTLSKSIVRLEKSLGALLFDRTGGAARPTIYGEFVAAEATKLLSSVDAFSKELSLRVKGEAGRLVIAVGPASRLCPLPQVMQQITTAFPNLQIVTRQVQGPLVVHGVADGQYDIAFSNSENADGHDDLIRIKLFDSPVIAAVRVGHPILAHSTIGRTELLAYPHASFRITKQFRAWLGDTTPDEDLHLHALISDDAHLIKDRALRSDAIARAPRFVFEEDIAAGRLAELPLPLQYSYECWMLTTNGHWQSSIVRRIADFAKGAAGYLETTA